MADAAAPLITDLTAYPVFSSKTAYMTALEDAIENGSIDQQREVLYRLSNTDTDNWTLSSTARHDD